MNKCSDIHFRRHLMPALVADKARSKSKVSASSNETESATAFVDEKAARRALKKLESKLPPPRAEILASMFAAFGDPTRLKLLFLMCQSELCVGDLAAISGVSASAVSHQLSGLRALRLVKARRAGRNTFYSADDEHIVDMLRLGLEHVREQRKQ
jgi:ArsR family transcriptional regulator